MALSESIGQVTVMTNALAQLDKARMMLSESRTLPEIKKIRDIAEAAKVYARAAHLGRESQNYAAEIALLASRKAGEILSKLKRAEPKPTGGRVRESEYNQTLKDTGTSERTAQRWQELSKVSDAAVEEYVQATKVNTDLDISTAGLLKKVQRDSSVKHPKPIVIPSNGEKSVAEMTARLTLLRSEFSDLNAVTKRVKSTNLDDASKTEVRTLIACLNQISRDAAERATRLSDALEAHS